MGLFNLRPFSLDCGHSGNYKLEPFTISDIDTGRGSLPRLEPKKVRSINHSHDASYLFDPL